MGRKKFKMALLSIEPGISFHAPLISTKSEMMRRVYLPRLLEFKSHVPSSREKILVSDLSITEIALES